ncbi:hypothetical protein GN956_G22256 [Arapaima gigas]
MFDRLSLSHTSSLRSELVLLFSPLDLLESASCLSTMSTETAEAEGPRGTGPRRVCVLVLLRLLLLRLSAVYCYNLEPERGVLYRGPQGAFFGFAVLQHQHDDTHW